MEEKRTSVFENGLIWFGAAVSIAEILTETYFAPLGFTKGLFAILIGHIIGCAMLFFAGLIGGKVRKSAMETAKMSFGSKGALLFSVLYRLGICTNDRNTNCGFLHFEAEQGNKWVQHSKSNHLACWLCYLQSTDAR